MRNNTALRCCPILQPLQCVEIATAVGLIVTSSLFFTFSNMKRETREKTVFVVMFQISHPSLVGVVRGLIGKIELRFSLFGIF